MHVVEVPAPPGHLPLARARNTGVQRALDLGAELVVLPASWGDGPGKASQWDLLTRARAHDAQAWLLAVDQAWTPDSVDGPYGIGRSVLADPTGEVRARLGGGEDVLVAEVDRETVARTRGTIPIL